MIVRYPMRHLLLQALCKGRVCRGELCVDFLCGTAGSLGMNLKRKSENRNETQKEFPFESNFGEQHILKFKDVMQNYY